MLNTRITEVITPTYLIIIHLILILYVHIPNQYTEKYFLVIFHILELNQIFYKIVLRDITTEKSNEIGFKILFQHFKINYVYDAQKKCSWAIQNIFFHLISNSETDHPYHVLHHTLVPRRSRKHHFQDVPKRMSQCFFQNSTFEIQWPSSRHPLIYRISLFTFWLVTSSMKLVQLRIIF